MDGQIKELIGSIEAGNAAQIQDQFASIMAQKVNDALDNMRVEVANRMFNND